MKRRSEVLVGIMVLVCLAIGMLGTLWLARGGLSSGYPLYARFSWGQGLKQGQPVLFAGVNVGFVKEIVLDDRGSVVTEMHINEDMKIPTGTIASIAANGFFGDVLVRLTADSTATTYVEEGDTIAVSPLQTVGMTEILGRADAITTTVQGITAALDTQLIRSGGVAEMRASLTSLNSLLRRAAVLVDTQSAQVSRLTAAMRQRVEAIDSASVDSTVRNAAAASQNLATLARDLDRTTSRVDSMLAGLNSGRGTMGRLLTDTSLFVQTRSTAAHYDSLAIDLRALVRDFMANPKKYINLSIF